MEKDKYLPLGTVALLKGGKRRIMITGYAAIDMTKKDKIYDYCGCMYPVGIIDNKQNLLFNHDDIESISAIGYEDDEAKEFLKELKENVTEENIKKMLEEVNKPIGE